MSLFRFLSELALWYSISLNTPGTYQLFKVGASSASSYSEYCFYRVKNDSISQLYVGRDTKLMNDLKRIKIGEIESGFSEFVRKDVNIADAEAYVLFKAPNTFWNIGCGYSYFWQKEFKYPRQCMKVLLEFKEIQQLALRVEYSTNFDDRRVLSLSLAKDLVFNPLVSWENSVVYRMDDLSYGSHFEMSSELKFSIRRAKKAVVPIIDNSLDKVDSTLGKVDSVLNSIESSQSKIDSLFK